MKLDINPDNVEQSFDEIATDLITNYVLQVNDFAFRFTEIEFYYFHEDCHKDEYTHEHKRNAGEWRFHNQGLDITFQSDSKSDGGILIRGLSLGEKFVNGPRKVVREIFQALGKVDHSCCLRLKKTNSRKSEIFKTHRHLPNKHIIKDFHLKPYRYLTDFEQLDISKSLKKDMQKNMVKI